MRDNTSDPKGSLTVELNGHELAVGQRWKIKRGHPAFEHDLIIGRIENRKHPAEPLYHVYVRYKHGTTDLHGHDGICVMMKLDQLARGVTRLMAENQLLPNWWHNPHLTRDPEAVDCVMYPLFTTITHALVQGLRQIDRDVREARFRSNILSASAVLEAIEPWLKTVRRPLWTPNCEDGEGDPVNSRFGGRPWLSKEASWPVCRCRVPMKFFLQINLDQLPSELGHQYGQGLLQLFRCMNDACREPKYQAFKTGHCVRIVKTSSQSVQEAGHVEAFAPMKIVSWSGTTEPPGFFDQNAHGLETVNFAGASNDESFGHCVPLGLEFGMRGNPGVYHLLLPSNKDKLGGWPVWIQESNYPTCPKCKTQMRHLFQLGARDHLSYVYCDLGIGTITQCPNHLEIVAFSEETS